MKLILTSSNMPFIIQELKRLDLTKDKQLDIGEVKKDRSISANGLQHLWYGQIAKHKGDVTALDVKNMCKDMLGLPILLTSLNHGDKIEFLLHKLDYYKHSYESRMKLIQCLEVTSLFNTKESKEYMENMIFYWNENGVPIKFKENKNDKMQ